MGVARIMETEECTHVYRMWKSIAEDNHTWVWLKSHFQEACIDREEIEQTSGAAGYGSANSVKHGEMEDTFMVFASAAAEKYVAVTGLTTTNGNLSTQLRLHEYQLRVLQAELCNLKVAAAPKTVDEK